MGFVLRASGAGFLVICLLACNPSPGRFTVRFDWAVTKPEAGAYRVEGEVLAPDGRSTPATPEPYTPGMSLRFEQVPYGEGLIVKVRLAPTSSSASGARYFGESQPFDFEADDEVEVGVRVSLTDSPELAGSLDAPTLEIVGATGDIIKRPDVQLRVRARGAETLQISQSFQFTDITSIAAAEALESAPDAEGVSTYLFDYDFNAGVPRCEMEPLDCEGLRTIFVRAQNQGLFSDELETTVTLDTVGPQVVLASVNYRAPSGSPVEFPSAASVGSSISISVNFNEAIDVNEPPSMIARSGDSTLRFLYVGGNDSTALYTGLVDSSTYAEGLYIGELVAKDIVGNERTNTAFLDPAITVDFTPPALSIAQSEVSFLQVPLRNAEPSFLGSNIVVPAETAYYALTPSDPLSEAQTLPSRTFSVDSDPASVIRVWAEETKSTLLATAFATPEGEWDRASLQLANVDTDRVYVTGFDGAGNESAPVLIENAWFFASSAAGNSPHVVSTAARPVAPLEFSAPVERAPVAALDGSAVAQKAERFWLKKGKTLPPPREGGVMAYDSARNRAVLFGGSETNDTWEWDGHSWAQLAPVTSPAARLCTTMSYNSSSGKVLLFGGQAINTALNDTWEWDGTNWIERFPSNQPPREGCSGPMAYDSARDRTVYFESRFGLNAMVPGRTWEWDGTDWTLVSQSGPFERNGSSMVYDSARERVVLFGGLRLLNEFEFANDTWEWDGATWREATPTRRPPARSNAKMVYDVERQKVVLFGGTPVINPVNESFDDVWEWDGAEWTEVSETVRPQGRNNHSMIYDHAQKEIIVFGGETSGVISNSMWRWNQEGWIELTALRPSERSVDAYAFDPVPQRTVLHGGRISNVATDNTTWEWDGTNWTEHIPQILSPSRRQARMAYNANRGRVMLFGGRTNQQFFSDLWEWDGVNWTEITSANSPPARISHSLSYDQARGRLVLFGGVGVDGTLLSDHWEFDGNDWLQSNPLNRPSARRSAAMVYDAARQRTLLHGGFSTSSAIDTWEFNGTNWVRVLEFPNSVLLRGIQAASYNSDRARVFLHLGLLENGPVQPHSWEWTGSDWIPAPTSGATPPPASQSLVVYDSARKERVLFGGIDSNNTRHNETWVGRAPTQPIIQFSAQLPQSLKRSQIQGVQVLAYCAGEHPPFAAGDSGAELLGWGTEHPAGQWEVLNTHNAGLPLGPPVSALLQYGSTSTPNSDDAKRLFGPQNRMYFQCRPAGPSALEPAEVALDYIEVRVHYQAR